MNIARCEDQYGISALQYATDDWKSEKISFNQLNNQTGHRIKYVKVDADTGEEVSNEDIVKGYALDKETFIEVSKEELEEVALESQVRGLRRWTSLCSDPSQTGHGR